MPLAFFRFRKSCALPRAGAVAAEDADCGYMMDISRNRVPTRETLDELLDLLLLRYNHLELSLEHTLVYAQHQEVWEGRSPMTPEDVRRPDREAAARGIELVLNQNSFGHMTRRLEHESYRRLAETPDGFTDPWGRALGFGAHA